MGPLQQPGELLQQPPHGHHRALLGKGEGHDKKGEENEEEEEEVL